MDRADREEAKKRFAEMMGVDPEDVDIVTFQQREDVDGVNITPTPQEESSRKTLAESLITNALTSRTLADNYDRMIALLTNNPDVEEFVSLWEKVYGSRKKWGL